MAAAVVVPALLALDRELTSVAPKRTLPTWYAGDAAHKTRPSGHNADDTPGSKPETNDADSIPEIRAGDFRLPLNAPFSTEQVVQLLVQGCRAGRIKWIRYIIFNRRIWSKSTGWTTRQYTGSNTHEGHFHVSCEPETEHENSTQPVGLARLLPLPPKARQFVSFQVNFPVMRQGDDEASVPGDTNLVKRAQCLLRWLGGYDGDIDGDYGPKMAAAVKTMMANDPKRSSANGTVFGEPEWRRAIGQW
jgi:hypothetical protein